MSDRKIWGYARISTTQQHLDRQIDALRQYGVSDENIIRDMVSGRTFNRTGWDLLKTKLLRKGDLLVITEIDRLGRDYVLIKEVWQELSTMGIEICVLEMPALSTANKSSLEQNLISSIIFELLSYTAQKEKEKIHSRQEAGIKASKERGVVWGRPTITAPSNFYEECAKWRQGTQTAVDTMRRTSLKRCSFYKLVKELGV